MRLAPVAVLRFAPISLPVFDDSWKRKCETCAHVWFQQSGHGVTEWRCSVVDMPRTFKGRCKSAYCIDARDGACGPDATLWSKA